MIQNLRLIELFAGYGSQALALTYLGIPYEHHFVCEFDKYAIQSYNEIHGTDFKVTDIRELTASDLNITETNKYKYLLTYSFPCTDLSVAGQMKGMKRDSGTSSSLLWEVERLLKECTELPQYLLMENVPQVIGKDNIKLFEEWVRFLVSLGYQNYYNILNAKDFGIPQNRERCFMVSILKSENKRFVFPEPRPLEKRLKDVLETEPVPEKYYIRSEKAQKLIQQLKDRGQLKVGGCDMSVNNPKSIDIANCITARYDSEISNQQSVGTSIIEAGYIEKGTGKHESNTVYHTEGVAPTIPHSNYPINVVIKNE